MARPLTFAPIRGCALLTNSNQTAEKRSSEEWPLYADLCTDLTICRVSAFYIYIDEIENASLKLGVFSPRDRKMYENIFHTDSGAATEKSGRTLPTDGTLWYWNTNSVYKDHLTQGGTSIPVKINSFYGCSKLIKKGSLLGVYRERSGSLHITIDGVDLGVAAKNIPGPDGLFGYVRIAVTGRTGRIKITLRSLACKTLDLSSFDIIEEPARIIDVAATRKAKCPPNDTRFKNVSIKGRPRLLRYNMSSRPRGICLVINNKSFKSKDKCREGTESDEEILRTLFKRLHFSVDVRRDLTRNKMEALLKHYGSEIDHSKFDAFVCVIMSHGSENDFIEGVDEKAVRVEELMAEFDAQNCPSLKDKPKLFFIQCCRGSTWDTQSELVDSLSSFGCSVKSDGVALHPDSTLARSACPKGADFLLAFATTPGYVALRSPSNGSVFMRILVEVISELHEDVHLLDMLTEVNGRVAEEVFKISNGKLTQIPAPATTLRAQVYL